MFPKLIRTTGSKEKKRGTYPVVRRNICLCRTENPTWKEWSFSSSFSSFHLKHKKEKKTGVLAGLAVSLRPWKSETLVKRNPCFCREEESLGNRPEMRVLSRVCQKTNNELFAPCSLGLSHVSLLLVDQTNSTLFYEHLFCTLAII